MKIKIEMDEQAEEEVIIRCRGMTEQIAAIQRAVSEAAGAVQKIVLYKGNTEYYLPMNDILFFETADHGVAAHTGNDKVSGFCKINMVLYNIPDTDRRDHTVEHKADTTDDRRWHRTDHFSHFWNEA